MRTLLLVLVLLGAPAALAAQADSVAAPAVDSTPRIVMFCDWLDVSDHYLRSAIWGGVIGVVAGTSWAIARSSRPDAGLLGIADFMIGPVMGGAMGVGGGMVVEFGTWGWDSAHGRQWRPGARDRAQRAGLLCGGAGSM